MFGEAPEGFNPVNVVLTPGELVLMMVNPMMRVTVGYQPIVGLPTIGVDIAA